MKRRRFLQDCGKLSSGLLTGYWLSNLPASANQAPNDRVSVAVIGVRGRGGGLLNTFASLPDVDVKYVCDLDENVLTQRVESVSNRNGKRPEAIGDFRRALDDSTVDAIVLGTPDHWHAIPTIMACQAGKDVYVEKPDGHNVTEGRTMAAAARKYRRIIQLGTQARSGAHLLSAVNYLSKGNLGRVQFAKAWESSKQGPIGYPADSRPPAGVNYDMWLGPAPKRPFNVRRFHGSWRWFFDYGTGDLGNDGVHRLDIARWALETAMDAQGVELPKIPETISAHGGKFYFDDAQEWPDTMMVTYEYPKALLTYEMRVWSRYQLLDESEGAAVFGDNGYVVIGNSRWRAFDERGKLIKEERGGYNDAGHAADFINSMRTRSKPAADLETIGHPSSLLCHLGNVAWRVGRSISFDSENYICKGDEQATAHLTRPEYRSPWLLPKISQL